MRFLFRWTFRVFLILVVLVVALVLLKDALLKSFLEQRIRSRTGLDVKIGKFELGLLSPTMTFENLKIYNTAEFGGSPFLEMPELHLECNAAALARQTLRFKLVRIHLSEMNVVESKSGRTNTLGLVKTVERLSSTNANNRIGDRFQFGGIETLNLTVGKVHYRSLKQPGRDAEVRFGLKNEIVTDIKTFSDLYAFTLNLMVSKGITLTGPAATPAITDPRDSKGPANGSARPPARKR